MRSGRMMPRPQLIIAVAVALISMFGVAVLFGQLTPELKMSIIDQPLIRFSETLFPLVAKPDENIVMSPISIHIALNMLLLGAKQNTSTRAGLIRTLGYDDEFVVFASIWAYESVLRNFERLSEHSKKKNRRHRKHTHRSNNGTEGSFKINVWNMIITRDDFEPKPKYIERIQSFFNGSLRQVNADKPEQNKLVFDELNNWAKDAGFEGNILTEKDISDSKFVMKLLSAINMEAHWFKKFDEIDYEPTDEEASKPGPSLLKEGAKCLVHRKYSGLVVRQFEKITGRSFRGIKIPLKSGVNFIILEPPKYTELAGLEDHLLKSGKLAQVLSALNKPGARSYGLTLPPFKFETDLDLMEPLKSAGLKEIFTKSAEFSRISDAKLLVSAAKHRALVEVNKHGIKAAAITTIDIGPLIPNPENEPEPEMLYVKNPFMFVVELSSKPLFIGHVVSV